MKRLNIEQYNKIENYINSNIIKPLELYKTLRYADTLVKDSIFCIPHQIISIVFEYLFTKHKDTYKLIEKKHNITYKKIGKKYYNQLLKLL